MGQLSTAALARATGSDRPTESATDQMVENVFAGIAKMLWPKNTAPFLASAIGCEVRSAERYLEGSRAWSGDAVAILVAEVLRRHHMRNFRVVKKT